MKINKKHKYLTAKIVEESRDIFESEFQGDFHVIISPHNYTQVYSEEDGILDMMKTMNITMIDHDIRYIPEIHALIDGHPTEELNKQVAEVLARQISQG